MAKRSRRPAHVEPVQHHKTFDSFMRAWNDTANEVRELHHPGAVLASDFGEDGPGFMVPTDDEIEEP